MAAPEEPPATPVPALASPPDPLVLVLPIGAPVDRTVVPALCERLRVLLEDSTVDVVVCDVGAVVHADAVVIDAVARLALTARRLGRRLRLLHPSRTLRELITFVGLDEVVGLGAGLPLEPGGQTEEREQACGVQEEHDPGDATA